MKTSIRIICTSVLGCAVAVSAVAPAFAVEIKLTNLASINNPIGIDYYEPNNTLVGSLNFSSGLPFNFAEIQSNGSNAQFSTVSGLTNEIKIATVRSGNTGGFTTGDLFTGNGVSGQIARVTGVNGASLINPFATLAGETGLMRGSLYVDRTGIFGDELIAVTTAGGVWQIDSAGNGSLLAQVVGQLEGLITVPDDVAKYGPLAGKIIAGQESTGSLFTIDTEGTVVQHANIGVDIEDIDMIVANENFFGMQFQQDAIFGADASDFSSLVGDILLTSEFGGVSTGLYRLFWDGFNLQTEELTLAAGSDDPSQWEHVTFAPARIGVPEPGVVLLLGTGLLGLVGYNRRRKKHQAV